MNALNLIPLIPAILSIALLFWLVLYFLRPKREQPKLNNPDQVIIKTYTGSQAKATALYQADVSLMASQGYFPTSQSWVPGTRSASDFIVALLLCFLLIGFIIFLYMLIVPPVGTLSVTYELRASPTNSAKEEKTCPKCAEQVKAAALVCRFCSYQFTSKTAPQGETLHPHTE